MRFPILRFGMVPVVNDSDYRSNFNQFCRALGYYLGTTVEGHTFPTHEKLVSLFSQAQVDAVWVPPVVALDCDARGVGKARVALKRQQKTSYHSVLFTQRDSSIRTVADLKSVRAAWVSTDSASGYLVPLASLRARGISLSGAFSEQRFAGSHGAVAKLVADGHADVGANFAHFSSSDPHTFTSSGWMEAGIEADLRMLIAAGPIPTDVIVMHRSMDEEHRGELASAFSWISTRPEASAVQSIFHGDGFEPCDDQHLQPLRKLIQLLDRRSRG